MFITPTPQEARKGEPPTIRVTTTSIDERVLKPETDQAMFASASKKALADALDNGYASVSFESVSEFVSFDTDQVEIHTVSGSVSQRARYERLAFEYVWTFTAWDQTDGNPEA